LAVKKPISVHVDEADYQELKEIAGRRGRPVAELVREAMATYLAHERGNGTPFLEIRPHGRGRQLSGWTRSEIYDEIAGRP
jgi:hypothetical protein